MKRLCAALLLAAATQANPAAAADPHEAVINSPHNVFARSEFPIGRRVCAGCHAEGAGAPAAESPAQPDEALAPEGESAPPPPLWQRSAAPYRIYSATRPAAASVGNGSDACLECHDGVLGQEIHASLVRNGKTFDHPSNVVYPRLPDGRFVPKTPTANQYRYWSIPDLRDGNLISPTGPSSAVLAASDPAAAALRSVRTSDGMVQCGSCHDPHDNGSAPFLRAPAQDLCFVCHDR
ncbi:MAG TPA: cytochrome c3 family protein [Nitrospiria bacterium]|nr:cytochrome c3 family protein [Nitrospiria bacterium]